MTADTTYSTVHPYHDVPTWPCATSALIPEKPWRLEAALCLCYGHGMATLGMCCGCVCWVHHKRIQRVCCYSCYSSQDRINVSAVSTIPYIFFQLCSLPTLGSVNSDTAKHIYIVPMLISWFWSCTVVMQDAGFNCWGKLGEGHMGSLCGISYNCLWRYIYAYIGI